MTTETCDRAGSGHNPVRASHDKGGAAAVPCKAPARQQSGCAGKEAGAARAAASRSHYELREAPLRLRVVAPPLDKPNPKKGIGAPTAAAAAAISGLQCTTQAPLLHGVDPCSLAWQVPSGALHLLRTSMVQ